ncbi:MAG: 4-hydroxy-tetrahydrodipicolinate synthase [Proteobacteria bacterium]|nr:4-hydroxy-tetrahydrodipicolinate synthase [Pseudomonadota bacterium]
MFKGAITAIVTPFKEGEVDWKSFEKLIEFQIKEGINGIVPCGTTGESATLSYEEHNKVIEFTVKKVKKRVPVIAGTGANSTEEAIELTEHAKKAGASASLQVCPYYNKPTQEGLYRHFKKIAETVDIPIVLYNIPGRTGINMQPDTIIRLSEIPNIVAIKEASGSLDQVTEIIKGVKKKNFTVLSGDDSLTLPMMSVGAKGVISVASNIIPKKISKMVKDYLDGKTELAMKAHLDLYELMKTLFIETNPIPVKSALSLMGMIKEEFRLPLCEMSPQNKERLRKVLVKYKIIKE